MRVFVTGAAGFIGSTLVDRLLAEGHRVHGIDDLTSGSLSNLAAARADKSHDFRFERLDIRSPAIVEHMSRARPEIVFHLAAQKDVRVSVARPVFDAEVNIIGSLNVLEGARLVGASKVVFASSGGTIYGDPDPSVLPVRESHAQHPVSPYGVAKKAIGDYLAVYHELHGLRYTALALANVYGPRQDPDGEAGVVSIFAGKLLGSEPCMIYGDGKQTRDFVFVDDAVDAFVRATDGGDQLLINIGTGRETSVNQLYATMAREAGIDAAPVFEAERPGELQRSALDPTRAAIQLGWKSWTTLEHGTRAVLDWYRADHLRK